MAKKKQEFVKQDEQLQEVNEALTGAGKWIEDNANLISWIVCGIAIVVMGVIAINNYVIKPKALSPMTTSTISRASSLRSTQVSAISRRASTKRLPSI